MDKLYKSGEASRILNLRQSTMREWRMLGYAPPKPDADAKDYLYSRLDLLTLGIMQEGRACGVPADRSWSLAFWSGVEVAKWLRLPDLDEYALLGQPGNNASRYAIIPSTSNDPIITSNIWEADYLLDDGGGGSPSPMVYVFDLKALANRLPERLKAELHG